MLVLAYCAGLRVGELARLNLGDIDLQPGAITIPETKFFKSRVLPLTDSALSALRGYLEARRVAKSPQSPDSGLFWHDQGDARYSSQSIARPLVDILRRAGIKPPKGKTGPRIHDLRHSFVVNRILEWYRAGINPQACSRRGTLSRSPELDHRAAWRPSPRGKAAPGRRTAGCSRDRGPTVCMCFGVGRNDILDAARDGDQHRRRHRRAPQGRHELRVVPQRDR